MDHVESVQFSEESLEDIFTSADINIYVKFKSGQEKTIAFSVPTETPLYGEAITIEGVYEILAASYSFGEQPFVSLPDGDGYIYLDLSSTDYIKVTVSKHE